MRTRMLRLAAGRFFGCTGLPTRRRSAALLARLNDASAIELGFPHDFLGAAFTVSMLHGDTADRLIDRDRRSRSFC
jgi:hypothetical protein